MNTQNQQKIDWSMIEKKVNGDIEKEVKEFMRIKFKQGGIKNE